MSCEIPQSDGRIQSMRHVKVWDSLGPASRVFDSSQVLAGRGQADAEVHWNLDEPCLSLNQTAADKSFLRTVWQRLE